MSDADLVAAMVVAGVGVAVALLAWVAVDVGTQGLARYRVLFTERTRVNLRELFLFVDTTRLWALNMALTLAILAAGTWAGGPVAGAAAGLITFAAPWGITRWLRRRRLLAVEQQLPDGLLLLAGGLRAGSSLAGALQQFVRESRPPLAQEFDLLLREQRLGVPLDAALEGLARRVPLQSVVLAVSAMRIAAETGGGLAEALERASHTLRSKLAMEGKIRALTSQGKLQAVVVGLLPLGMLAALMKLEPEDMGLLFTTHVGWGTLAAIVLLEVFGVVLIRKIVAIDV